MRARRTFVVSGIRCDKCKKEVSHVTSPFMPEVEATIIEHEDQIADDHRRVCDGTVTRFETMKVKI